MKKRILFFLTFIGVIILLRYSGISNYISLQKVQEQSVNLQKIVMSHYWSSVILFILLYIFVVAVSLPLAAVFTITSGFLFGTIPGALYSNIGATIGATLAFLIVRYIIGKTLQKKYAVQLQWFNAEMHHYGSAYLLVVHFIAVIPFFIVNTLAGLTNVSTLTFIWTTSMGILPGSLVYAFAGQQLHAIESAKDIFSSNIILAFLLLTLFAIVPIVIKRMRDHKKNSRG